MCALFLYHLVDPAELVSVGELIREDLFQLPNARGDHSFSVSPMSSWITFRNDSQVQSEKRKRGLPRSEREAERAAHGYLRGIALRQQSLRRKAKAWIGIPDLIPRSLKPLTVAPVLSRFHQGRLDHWLCRYAIFLPLQTAYRERNVPLLGAGLDLRVGENGQVEAFSLRWRPIRKRTSLQEIAALDIEPLPLAHSHHSHAEKPPTQDSSLVYVSAGESHLQTHLAPFYSHSEGHHVHFTPATAQSTMVRFQYRIEERGIQVQPIVAGGSGDFNYDWASWDMFDPLGHGLIERGTNANCQLEFGVHCLLLTLTDAISRQVVQYQEIVYGHGEVEAPRSIERWGCTDPTASNYDPMANCEDGTCIYPVT